MVRRWHSRLVDCETILTSNWGSQKLLDGIASHAISHLRCLVSHPIAILAVFAVVEEAKSRTEGIR